MESADQARDLAATTRSPSREGWDTDREGRDWVAHGEGWIVMYHRLATTRAREKFADILNDVAFKGERILLHRHGKDVAAVISAEDLALLEQLEEHADLEAIREALREGGPNVRWSELKSELGL